MTFKTNRLFLTEQEKYARLFTPLPHAGGSMTHKRLVRVQLLSLPNIKNESLALLLDRIDIHIKAPRVDYKKLSNDRMGESFETIRKRVQAARNIQRKRFLDSKSDIVCSADMHLAEIRKFFKL